MSKEYMIKESDYNDLYAIEDVLVVGYPDGLYDQYNYRPIFKKGIAATDIKLDYNGRKEFLIDASTVQGSSGSPVFIIENGFYKQNNQFISGSRFLFAGILYSVLEITYEGRIINKAAPDREVPTKSSTVIPTQLCGVIKVSRLLELTDCFRF